MVFMRVYSVLDYQLERPDNYLGCVITDEKHQIYGHVPSLHQKLFLCLHSKHKKEEAAIKRFLEGLQVEFSRAMLNPLHVPGARLDSPRLTTAIAALAQKNRLV
jgi:hypothetical protein